LGLTLFQFKVFLDQVLRFRGNLSDFETPYLENRRRDGLGLNANYEFENARLIIGASTHSN